jgi:hypothetical protein
MTEDEVDLLVTDLTRHLVELEQRVAAGQVTDPGILALAHQVRATLDLSKRLGAEFARRYGNA